MGCSKGHYSTLFVRYASETAFLISYWIKVQGLG